VLLYGGEEGHLGLLESGLELRDLLFLLLILLSNIVGLILNELHLVLIICLDGFGEVVEGENVLELGAGPFPREGVPVAYRLAHRLPSLLLVLLFEELSVVLNEDEADKFEERDEAADLGQDAAQLVRVFVVPSHGLGEHPAEKEEVSSLLSTVRPHLRFYVLEDIGRVFI